MSTRLTEPIAAKRQPLRHPCAKRTFDVIASSVALVVLSPVMAVVAFAVRATSPGPALFRQRRIGRDQRPFLVLKFRTMVDGAERLGRETAGSSDPRITEFGAILRRTKLDELPQLVNVLRGEMSVVGPRPEIPFYAENYNLEDRVVLSVRPGITDPSSLQLADLDGLMETRGNQSPADFYSQVVQPQKMQLQKQYIANQTLLGDVRIVLATIARIVQR